MRTTETLMLIFDILAFITLAAPRVQAVRWLSYATPAAVLVAAIQALAEGWRWQMIPAYALAVVFFLIWLLGVSGGVHVGRLAAGIGIGLGMLALVASVALPLALPVFRFRNPTGKYAIGTVTYHWEDKSRPEIFTTSPNDHRELMAQVWYPAKKNTLPRAPYIEDAETLTPVLARLYRFPSFFFSHLKYVKSNAAAAAPMADDKPKYPVLIFLPGLNGYRQMNTFQTEELVSQGYIVVGLDQPGNTASVRLPDGRQIDSLGREVMYPLLQQSVEPFEETPKLLGKPMPDGIVPYFAQDVSFALDQLEELNAADSRQLLTGRLDLGRIGIFGMSGGGIYAAEACHKDPRLKACLIMDVFAPADVAKDGLKQPAMWITRDADTMRLERQRSGGWTEKDIEQHQTTMRAAYGKSSGGAYYIQVPRMFHLNLTDVVYWSPVFPQLGLLGPIDGQRTLGLVNAYTVAFFNKHLTGQSEPLLDGPARQYPEAFFETHGPN